MKAMRVVFFDMMTPFFESLDSVPMAQLRWRKAS
jgi:hypothetical protein